MLNVMWWMAFLGLLIVITEIRRHWMNLEAERWRRRRAQFQRRQLSKKHPSLTPMPLAMRQNHEQTAQDKIQQIRKFNIMLKDGSRKVGVVQEEKTNTVA